MNLKLFLSSVTCKTLSKCGRATGVGRRWRRRRRITDSTAVGSDRARVRKKSKVEKDLEKRCENHWYVSNGKVATKVPVWKIHLVLAERFLDNRIPCGGNCDHVEQSVDIILPLIFNNGGFCTGNNIWKRQKYNQLNRISNWCQHRSN